MRAAGLVVAVAVAFGAAAEEPIVKGDLGTELDGYLSRIEANGFSGSVLIAKDGEPILAKGYGYADREHRARVTTATVFDIGSLTKQFTGAAILKLQEAGSPRRWRASAETRSRGGSDGRRN